MNKQRIISTVVLGGLIVTAATVALVIDRPTQRNNVADNHDPAISVVTEQLPIGTPAPTTTDTSVPFPVENTLSPTETMPDPPKAIYNGPVITNTGQTTAIDVQPADPIKTFVRNYVEYRPFSQNPGLQDGFCTTEWSDGSFSEKWVGRRPTPVVGDLISADLEC